MSTPTHPPDPQDETIIRPIRRVVPPAPQAGPPTDTWVSVPHYIEGRKIEPILVIEDWNLDFHLGNVIKYIAKLGRDGVDSLTTLKKAQSYLDRAVHVQLMRDCPF